VTTRSSLPPSHRLNQYPATFTGGEIGTWIVQRVTAISGDGLPSVPRLQVESGLDVPGGGTWQLKGVAGHLRYTDRDEKTQLDPVSPVLGRADATCAALIPIRKSDAWWALTQDERREIFETRSRHIADSMPYLPRIARRLYHCRDLGGPFDFLTWFEFSHEHIAAFDELLSMLRARHEWTFVDREVEVRLVR